LLDNYYKSYYKIRNLKGITMKCSKCKYTTFDYFDTCPRCGKDISGEKVKLNILAIKPNTPFLLGSLTGDLNDSSAAFVVPGAVKEASESLRIDTNEIYDDGSELNINIDEQQVAGPEVGSAEDIGDLSSTETEQDLELDFDSGQTPEEIGEQEKPQEAVYELDEGGDQPDVSEGEAKRKDEALDLDIEDLDLQLEISEDEDSDK
jgi:hypothetical protein